MISKLKIYKTELTPNKNWEIEEIEKFLAEQSKLTYQEDNFQYQQLGLNKSITIAANQEKVGKAIGNYLSIEQDNKKYYYFINSADWTAVNTVRLNISMDTINTFKDDFEFTAQTQIEREHQARFSDTGLTSGNKKILRRTIDKIVEGIPATQELKEQSKIKDKVLPDLDWYLIYETKRDLDSANISNPVDCKLVASKEILIKEGHQNLPSQTLKQSDLEDGIVYYLDPKSNPNGSFKYFNSQGVASKEITLTDTDILTFTKRTHDIQLAILKYDLKDNFYVYNSENSKPTLASAKSIEFINSSSLKKSPVAMNSYTDILSIQNYYPIITGTVNNVTTIPYNQVSKSNTRLMKIIKLPYCPINITKSGNVYLIPEGWDILNGMLVLKNDSLSEQFERKINELNLDNLLKIQVNPQPLDNIIPENESKLLSSEFTTYKISYDSFGKEIRLEDLLAENNRAENKVDIRFKPTNTINSKFAFKLDYPANLKYQEREDYENYLLATRNNEETIFSNDYLNYIRNGYNYDKKKLERAKDWGIGSAGIQAAALGLLPGAGSLVSGFISNTAALARGTITKDQVGPNVKQGIKSAYGGEIMPTARLLTGVNIATSLVKTLYEYEDGKLAIEQKKNLLAQQATNVSGTDDIDLLSYYNGNRLNLLSYEPDQNAKDLLVKYFHYAGYKHPKQELPNLNSRYWFNYIQCSPVFKNESTAIYNDYLTDIKTRYENGITVLHYHPEFAQSWDIYQEHENWESNLIDTSYYPKTKLANLQISGYVFSQDTLIGQFNYQDFDDRVNGAEIKFTNTFGEELIVPYESIDTTDGTISFEARDIDLTKPIYVRETALYNSKLNSDWMLWKEYN